MAVTNGIKSNGIGLTITNGSIDSKMDAIRVKQTNTNQPAIRSTGNYYTINITGNVESYNYPTIVIDGNV